MKGVLAAYRTEQVESGATLSSERISGTYILTVTKCTPNELIEKRVEQIRQNITERKRDSDLPTFQPAAREYYERLMAIDLPQSLDAFAPAVEMATDEIRLGNQLLSELRNSKTTTKKFDPVTHDVVVKTAVAPVQLSSSLWTRIEKHPLYDQYREEMVGQSRKIRHRQTVVEVHLPVATRFANHIGENAGRSVINTLAPVASHLKLFEEGFRKGFLIESGNFRSKCKETHQTFLNAITRLNDDPLATTQWKEIGDAIGSLSGALDGMRAIIDPDLRKMAEKNISQTHRDTVEREIKRQCDVQEAQYRASVEARCLRLLREVQARPAGEGEPTSAELKIARQLSTPGLEGVKNVLRAIEDEVRFSEKDLIAIECIFAAEKAAEVAPASDLTPQSAGGQNPGSDEVAEVDQEVSEIDPAEEFELKQLYLLQIGVEDEEEVKALCERLPLAVLQQVEVALRKIPEQVVRAVLTSNRGLLEPQIDISAYGRKLSEVLALTKGLDSFEVFDPVRFPAYFHSLEALEKTADAVRLLRKVVTDVEIEFKQMDQSATDRAEARSSPTADIAHHPERHLIERLARLTRYPRVAYAIMRYSFFYQGKYHGGAVEERMRDRRIEAAFEKLPLPAIVRQAERDLINLGFLSRSTALKAGSKPLALTSQKLIGNSEVKELLRELTRLDTFPSNAPRLPLDKVWEPKS